MKQVASGDRAGAEERDPSVAPSPRYRVCPKGDKMSWCIKNKRVQSFSKGPGSLFLASVSGAMTWP